MCSFDKYHPIVLFVYAVTAMFVTMLSLDPIILCMSVVASFWLCMTIQNSKVVLGSLSFYLPMFVLLSLVNPLFSHNGETILFFMNGQQITLEAILYGMAIAGMIIALLLWGTAYSELMTTDKFLWLFGAITPKLALIISSAIRFTPLFVKKMKRINAVQRTLGYYAKDSFFEKIGGALRVFSAVVSMSLDSAIDTADSMRARGYGKGRRSNFSIFKFRTSDLVMLILTIAELIFFVVLMSMQYFKFNYYPQISGFRTDLVSILKYVVLAIFMFTPLIIEIKESIKWRYLISRT